MSIPVRYARDRAQDLEEIILDLQEQRIRQAGFITQFIAMRDLQVLCNGPHSVFDAQRLTESENATDDLIDNLKAGAM